MDTVQVAVTVGVPVLGFVVWLLRLEGRVNLHDSKHDNHEKNHETLVGDVRYIRERIDRALNGRHD